MTYQTFKDKIAQIQEQCTQVHDFNTWTQIQQNLNTLLEKEPDYVIKFCQEFDLHLWPSQKSAVEAIIAHVLYPHEALEETYQAYGVKYSRDLWMLTTRLTMTRLAFAATYGASPVALFYLAYALRDTALWNDDMTPCPNAMHACTAAISIFATTATQAGHPLQDTAKYYLARFYRAANSFPGIVPSTAWPSQNIFKILSGVSTPQVRILRLTLRHSPEESNPPEQRPTFQDFKNTLTTEEDPVYCAQMYEVFSKHFMTAQEHVEHLTKLIEKKPHFLLHRKVANLYAEANFEVYDLQKALVHWQAEADHGSFWAYEKLLRHYAPPKSVFQAFNLSNIADDDDYEECRKRIQKMADLGYPEAFEHLFQLMCNTPRISAEPVTKYESNQAQLRQYLKEAARYGYWPIYHKLPQRFLTTELANYPDLQNTRRQLYALTTQRFPLGTLPSKESIHSQVKQILENSRDEEI